MLLKGAINSILYTSKFSMLVNSQLVCLPPVNDRNKMEKLKIIEKKQQSRTKEGYELSLLLFVAKM